MRGERTATRPAVSGGAPATALDTRPSSNSLDLLTLGLAALGSALAALVTSQFWEQGTVISAAVTPVIISLVKEGLRRPAERASRVGVRVATASKGSLAVTSRRGASEPILRPRTARGADDHGRPALAVGPARIGGAPPPTARGPRIYRRRGRPRLRIALITGALAFVIAVFALTVPQLVLGGAPGRDGGTTFFGGGDSSVGETDGSSDEGDADSQAGDPGSSEAESAPESESAPAPEEAEPVPAPQEEAAPAEPQASAAPAPSGD